MDDGSTAEGWIIQICSFSWFRFPFSVFQPHNHRTWGRCDLFPENFIISLSEPLWRGLKALWHNGFHRSGNHSHSLRLNTFCIIIVCLIPSGDSDSLWYSYSTACTTSGYHFVIRVITGETVLLWRFEDFHKYSIAQNGCWRKRKDIWRINAFEVCPSDLLNLNLL